MDAWSLGLAGALLLVLVAWVLHARRLRRLLRTLKASRQSQATRYGQITEQFAPFLATWPYDPKRFRFIGSPIDGIQFTDDEVILVEVKSAGGRLSREQSHVRSLVAAGRVRFEEIRIA